MGSTAMAAVEAHMAAINSKQRERFAATIAFPFVHIEANGEKVLYGSAADVPDLGALPFARSEVAGIETLAESNDLAVYLLSWQRYDENGKPAAIVRGIWGVHRRDGEWKVGWRQYLGAEGATSHQPVLSHLAPKAPA